MCENGIDSQEIFIDPKTGETSFGKVGENREEYILKIDSIILKGE